MKKKYIIDLTLIPIYILVLYTGLSTHLASKGEVVAGIGYCSWSLYHLTASCIGVILTIIHITQHWQWYKNLFARKSQNKSIYSIILSLIVVVMIATGIIILITDNHFGYMVGLIHNKLGLIMAVLILIHVFGRISWIIKQTKNILKK